MRFAVMSDSHDNIWKLEAAEPALRSVDAILHCGDLCSPFMIRRLGQIADGRPVHLVWGNNDGDPLLISQVAAAFPDITLHGQLAEIELGGLRIAINHYPAIAAGLARSGSYDVVCFGHDHTRHESREGECLLLNPGELMGLKGPSSLAIVEVEGRTVAWIEP
jgi:putative phosphoesterase